MNTVDRIEQLLSERGWSYYRLAKEAGLSNSTIANIYRRNAAPSIPTLECICQALGITIAQFFMEEGAELVPLTKQQMALFDKWVLLTDAQKRILELIIDEFS